MKIPLDPSVLVTQFGVHTCQFCGVMFRHEPIAYDTPFITICPDCAMRLWGLRIPNECVISREAVVAMIEEAAGD